MRLERLAQGKDSAADIRRQLVVAARELGIPPPSYEHVRRLVLLERLELADRRGSEIPALVIDVAIGREHGNELLRVARGGKRYRH